MDPKKPISPPLSDRLADRFVADAFFFVPDEPELDDDAGRRRAEDRVDDFERVAIR